MADIADRLPPPAALESRCKALALLDAILSPDWEFRYYSFNRHWDRERGQRMASFRDGSGSEYFILFYREPIAALKGLAKEIPNVARVLDGLPASFDDFAREPAFSMDDTTFCLWNEGDGWRRSRSVPAETIEEDGSSEMLHLLAGTPEDYATYAREYFEIDVSAEVVARFFGLEPFTESLARELHPDFDDSELAKDLEEIGYPIARNQSETEPT
jgi:hypothetical protein